MHGIVDFLTIFTLAGATVLFTMWIVLANSERIACAADALAKMDGLGFIETTWNTLSGKGGWGRMYTLGAAAAWGTSAKGRDAFANALRTVDNDMGAKDYRDTGVVNRQTVPESFLK